MLAPEGISNVVTSGGPHHAKIPNIRRVDFNVESPAGLTNIDCLDKTTDAHRPSFQDAVIHSNTKSPVSLLSSNQHGPSWQACKTRPEREEEENCLTRARASI